MSCSLKRLAELVGGEVEGNENLIIEDVAEIQHAGPKNITFLANRKYTKYLNETPAGAIIVTKDVKCEGKNLVKVDNPHLAFSKAIGFLRPGPPKPKPGIHPTAVIDKTSILGNDIYIGPYVVIKENAIIENGASIDANSYIGQNVRVGAKSTLHNNVTIYHGCTIGQNCILSAGVIIGNDGYGYVRDGDGIRKIPQSGCVIIGNDVEIGANACIDRGTVGNTEIGDGSKIDNMVQIAHNVKIGKYCFIVSQTGIAGTATIEDGVTIAGQVGIAGHLTIGKGAMIAAKSGVSKSVPAGAIMFGYPARIQREARRDVANIRLLPELKERVKALEQKIKDFIKE